MTKKKKPAIQPNLSPENYIKTRARTLPIYKCFVSDNWEETNLPTVVVSRRHSNGNVSACLYTVDLNCLGVVYTDFLFNVEEKIMMEIVEHYFDEALIDTQYIKIDYPLAHNIVYAGIEFALEWGIPVQKKLYVTREFLEPDDDHIELIEIDCGIKGAPAFNPDLYEDFFNGSPDVIVKKLEINPGPENYTIIHHYDSDENLEDDWGDEDDDDLENDGFDDPFNNDKYPDDEKIFPEDSGLNDYTQKDFEKDKKFILKYFRKLKAGAELDDPDKLEQVLERLADHMADEEMVENYYDELFDVELDQIVYDSLPEGFITLNNSIPGIEKKVVDVLLDYMADDRRPRKNIKKLEKLIGDQPLIEYLSLTQDKLEDISTVSIDHKLQKALMKFPDYPMLKLFHFNQLIESSAGALQLPEESLCLSNFFAGRDEIHIIEFQAYVGFLVNYLSPKNDLERIIALEDWIIDQILHDELFLAFKAMILGAKMFCVHDRLIGIRKP